MLLAGALAAWLYRRALGFAFFNDDPTGHFAWMEGRSIVDFFTSSAEYGYYRPVVFTALQSVVLLGGYSATLFHALLLVLHGLNVALLWLLAWRLSESHLFAWAAAVLFATVPFNYEAVAYVASLTHPLLLLWTLLTLLLYGQARTRAGEGRPARFFYAAAAVTLALGLLTHENGLFIPLMLVGVEWLLRPPRRVRDAWRRPFLPYFVAPLLYLLLWLAIPKNSEQALPTIASIGRNLLPFLQTLVYPLLPLLTLTAENVLALLLLSVAAGAALLAVALLVRAGRLWAFGVAWFAFSALPAVLFLDTAYLYGSPRLSYVPAVGVALLWALPALALQRLAERRAWPRAAVTPLSIAFVLALALPPLPFIRCQLDFYAETSAIVRRMSALAHGAPAGEPVVFVNVPFFFSSYAAHPQGCANPYPWTPVGGVVIPPYASAADFVRFNGGPQRPIRAVVVDAYAPGWNTFGEVLPAAALREVVDEAAVYVYDLPSGGFFALSEAWRPGDAHAPEPLATFGEALRLMDAAVNNAPDAITVTLAWEALGPAERPLTAFVHLYDAAGALVAQHDGPPAQNFAPGALWQAGDVIHDQHTVPLAQPLPPGEYRLVAGVYDPTSGERLAAADGRGAPLADNVYEIAQISVES